jgi:hypothetical protein
MDLTKSQPVSPKEGFIFVAKLEDIPKGEGRVF